MWKQNDCDDVMSCIAEIGCRWRWYYLTRRFHAKLFSGNTLDSTHV